jgi:hypothetical protein
MRIGNKTVALKTNKVNKSCPICERPLKFKPKCCAQKDNYNVCSSCGYKVKV